MLHKNNVPWATIAGVVSCLACTTAQQGASSSTSTSPSSGAGVVANSAQAAEPEAQPPKAGATPLVHTAGSIGVADIASRAVGSKVTVSGVFMGFNGACLSEAPSRSAWHLAASKEPKAPCVYVDGPFPPGLSPAVHSGTSATVTGTIAELGGARYLVSTGH